MMPAKNIVPEEAVRLLGEAAEWRLLGLLFEYPSETWRRQMMALLPDLRDSSVRAMADAALELSSEGLHIALFGPAGTVPVREVTWRGGVQFGYLMSELAAFYDAFGYTPSAEEASDHLAIETGFIAYLRLKQALALAAGDAGKARLAADAAASFVKEHIAVVAEPVARALETFAPDYLIEAGRRILGYAGPAPRCGYPLTPSQSLEDDESAEMSCGSPPPADQLVQLPS